MNYDKFEKTRFNFDKKRIEKICKSLNYNFKKQGIIVDFQPDKICDYDSFRVTNTLYNFEDPNRCVFEFGINLKDFYVVDNFKDIFKSNFDMTLEIYYFSVETKNMGIGTKAINAFKKTFKSFKFEEINLFASDDSAINFWENQGFIKGGNFGENLTYTFK